MIPLSTLIETISKIDRISRDCNIDRHDGGLSWGAEAYRYVGDKPIFVGAVYRAASPSEALAKLALKVEVERMKELAS